MLEVVFNSTLILLKVSITYFPKSINDASQKLLSTSLRLLNTLRSTLNYQESFSTKRKSSSNGLIISGNCRDRNTSSTCSVSYFRSSPVILLQLGAFKTNSNLHSIKAIDSQCLLNFMKELFYFYLEILIIAGLKFMPSFTLNCPVLALV